MPRNRAPSAGGRANTAYIRSQYTREPYGRNRILVLVRDPHCQYCQAELSTTADHVISVYDADSAVGAGLMTVEQARTLVNDVDNLLGVCRACNSSKGDRSPGNRDGFWQPRNPSPRAIDVMKRLGNWEA